MANYMITTYGCQMNVHDSEKIAGILEGKGYMPTISKENADIIVFNTCCIRDSAEQKALNHIGQLRKFKKANPELIIAVVGCMSQQQGYAEMFKQKYPYVDIVLGTRNVSELSRILDSYKEKRAKFRSNDLLEEFLNIDETMPSVRTSYPNAWINIIYGCNNFCSYCIVPHVRGRELSRSMDKILSEVKECVDGGFKEITLLGQNVNSYGKDLNDGTSFAKLLKEIDKIEGKFRIRFMTSHPKDLNEEIVGIIANSKNICKNIHLPVQAGSDITLKAMNRRYDSRHYLSLIEMIRKKMPQCGITSDVMVGFPTETEEDFLDTLNLVKTAKFSTAFTFVFSPRKGTEAEKMPQIEESVKKDRIMRLVALQNSITREESKKYLNKEFEVLVEGEGKEDGIVCGRTDSGRLVSFQGEKENIGEFVTVKVTAARTASLFGEIVASKIK